MKHMQAIRNSISQTTVRAMVALFFGSAVLIGAACGRSGDIELESGIRVQTRIVDAAGNPGFYADLEINPQSGQPGIAYYDLQAGDLRYAELNPATGQWIIEDVDTDGDVGGYPQLEYTQTGRPHIVYYDFIAGTLKYALFNGLEWERQVIPFARETEGFVAMRLDRNEIAHISTVDSGNFNLQYMVYDSETRSLGGLVVDDGTLTTGRGGNVNARMSLELRQVGNEFLPVVAYYSASLGVLNLSWMERGGGGLAFTLPRTVDGVAVVGASDVGQWVSTHLSDVVQGGEDNPDDAEVLRHDLLHMSYYDASNQDLKYASFRWSTTETTVERIDTDGVVGETSSVAVDGLGRPNISYYDGTNNDLKIAFRTPDGRWFTKRVDLQGIVGSYSSISLLPGDGTVGIAYRDTSRQALKFSVVQTN